MPRSTEPNPESRYLLTNLRVKEGDLLDSWLIHPSYPVAQERLAALGQHGSLQQQLVKAQKDGFTALRAVNFFSCEATPAPIINGSALLLGPADEKGPSTLLPLANTTGPGDFKTNQIIASFDNVPLENLGLRLMSTKPVRMFEGVACPECRHHLGLARTAADFDLCVQISLGKSS